MVVPIGLVHVVQGAEVRFNRETRVLPLHGPPVPFRAVVIT